MKLEIIWNNISIIEINRARGIYISSINAKNFIDARNMGMPIFDLINIKIISKELPKFIEERIPPKKVRDSILDVISSDEGSNILRYIEITKCKLKTDKFEIHLKKS